jgi:hypothetical protein
MSVASCTNHTIPEITLTTLSSLYQSAVQLKDMDDYFHFKTTDDSLKLPPITKAITDKCMKIWLMAMKANIHSYEDFKISFLNQFWNQGLQSHTRA